MHPKKFVSGLMTYAIAFSIVGCASSPRRSSASEENPTTRALEMARERNSPDAREYEAIDREYRARSFENVIKRAKAFTKAHAQSPFLEHVYNLRGLAHIGLKQYDAAIPVLQKTRDLAHSDNLQNMASYNLGFVYFELGRMEPALQSLEKVKAASLDRSDQMKVHILKAKIAKLRNDHSAATQDILAALRAMPEPRSSQATAPLLTFLDETLDSISNVVVLERLLNENQSGPGSDRLYFKIGNHYFTAGEREKAKTFFKKVIDDYSDSKHYSAAKEMIGKLEFQGVVETRRVGVVLTLSGKFGKFGQKALQGIELAAKIFNPGHSSEKQITLVVMDDQGDPERANAAMDELFYKHHVSAVIGPLVSKLAEPMGKKAQELGIPLLTLTQKESEAGDYVFNAGLTPAMQVRELIRYATEKAGAKNFAMLSPSNKFGEEYVKSFWDETERVSGTIRGYEEYQNDETDFRTYIDKLVGLNQSDARSREVEELRLLKAATPTKSRSKKFDRMFDLKPIVDFQAVFIPDEPKALGQILPTFAYRDVEKILFLGINTWNSQELIARAGQFAEGAVFVDGFYSGSKSQSSQKFIEGFRETFHSEPTIIEAMAFDAANILASIIKDSDPGSRSSFRDKILGLRDFQGVTGKISYSAGRLTKQLTFLTVKGGKIEEIAFQ